MSASICIFEDTQYDRLLPLVFFRPVYNLKCGIFSLKEKILRRYPKASVILHCRSYLAEYMRLRNPGVRVNEIPGTECLFINGRVIAHETFEKQIPLKSRSDVVYVHNGEVVAARVSGTNLKRLKSRLGEPLSIEDFEGIPTEEVVAETVAYPWDLVHRNGTELKRDFAEVIGRQKGKKIRGKVYAGVHLVNKSDIVVDEGASIKPGTVLDAEDGPIYIGKNVRVFPNATLIGPLCIGDGSWIKVGAQIYENTTIGPMCKVGGEVEESIIHGYSNKQHAGFLGHAYIGAWVNLGADTNNSDLKNNYGKVTVQIGNQLVDTGLQFVGLTMGDHSKSAINSMFNTGTVVGVSSNIFGSGFPPKYVPSFSWGAAGETFTTFSIDRAIEVARRMMARRKIELTATEEKLFRKIFELTSPERKRQGMPM
jgi:UDP-N-acetylglucosamine diphosphorylase/glucosamine-1-phosphate N-acetyltransferase